MDLPLQQEEGHQQRMLVDNEMTAAVEQREHHHAHNNPYEVVPYDTVTGSVGVVDDGCTVAAATFVAPESERKRSWEEVMQECGKEQNTQENSGTPASEPAGATKRARTGKGPTSSSSPNKQWNVMFERLKAYKEKYGDCLVPKRFPEDPKLGTWVETQRVQYKRLQRQVDEESGVVKAVQPNKRLDQERLLKLNEIGFAWSAKHVRKSSKTGSSTISSARKQPSSQPGVEPGRGGTRWSDNQWEEMYLRLVKYKEAYGDCLVPRKFDQDPKLATWVETQRVLWNRDLRNAMAAGQAVSVLENQAAEPSAVSQTDEQVDLAAWAASVPEDEWNMGTTDAIMTETTEFGVGPGLSAAGVVETAIEDPVCLPEMAPDDYEVVAAAVAAAAEAVDADPKLAATSPAVAVKPPANNNNKKLTKDRKERLDALGFVWSLRSKRIEDHWDQMFRQLLEYKEKHGDCLVPSRYEENLKLGKWVETQRYEYTKLQRATGASGTAKEPPGMKEPPGGETSAETGKPRASNPRLTEERRRRLEGIGFEWKVRNKMKRYYDKQWQDMFERLLKFKQENGHCIVPKRYPPDMKLGTWVHTQRIQYRKLKGTAKSKDGGTGSEGEPSAKSKDGGLESESVAKNKDGAGSEGEANQFDESNGGIPKGEELSFRLTEERRKRLEEIGFVWSAREGDVSAVAKVTKAEGGKRKSQTKGSVSAAASARVTRNSYDDLWDAMYLRLTAFKEKHGHCLVPKRNPEDPKLGTWVDTQRVQYKKLKKKVDDKGKVQYDSDPNTAKGEEGAEAAPTTTETTLPPGFSGPTKPSIGRLTEERIQRLENLGFVWSLRDDWMKHYEELKLYKQEFGNCNVPARYTKNRRLGIWVSAQRQQYKTLKMSGAVTANTSADEGKKQRPASLTPERINLLNELGFTWTIRSRDSLGESWNLRLADLKEYKKKFGNCLVPSRFLPNPELGVWVGTQRTQYRLYQKAKETGQHVPGASAMSEDRIRQLEELGFVWALRGTDGTHRRELYANNNAFAERDQSPLMETIAQNFNFGTARVSIPPPPAPPPYSGVSEAVLPPHAQVQMPTQEEEQDLIMDIVAQTQL